MAKLISFDEKGEAWFDNPQLILANPRRRRARKNPGSSTFGMWDPTPRQTALMAQGYDVTPRAFESPNQAVARLTRKQRAALTKRVKALYRKRFGKKSAYARRKAKMAKQMSLFGATKKRRKSSKRGRNAKGRFVKGHRVSRRRRATSRSARRARFSVRVRGRRRAYAGRSRGRVVRIRINRPRRFRRNSLMGSGGEIRLPFGLALPAVTDMLFAGAGVVAPPMISAQVQAMLPTSITGMAPTVVPWLSDIASVVVPGMLIKRFVGQRQGNAFLIGGGAMLVIKAIKAFAPASMLSTLGLSGYFGAQPLLGAYTDRMRAGAVATRRAGYPAIVSSAPERLSPMNRF